MSPLSASALGITCRNLTSSICFPQQGEMWLCHVWLSPVSAESASRWRSSALKRWWMQPPCHTTLQAADLVWTWCFLCYLFIIYFLMCSNVKIPAICHFYCPSAYVHQSSSWLFKQKWRGWSQIKQTEHRSSLFAIAVSNELAYKLSFTALPTQSAFQRALGKIIKTPFMTGLWPNKLHTSMCQGDT